MGKVISELSQKGIKLNITAVYSSQQTKKVIANLSKKQKQLSQFLQVEWQIKEKINYHI